MDTATVSMADMVVATVMHEEDRMSAYATAMLEASREDLINEVLRQHDRAEAAEARAKLMEEKLKRGTELMLRAAALAEKMAQNDKEIRTALSFLR